VKKEQNGRGSLRRLKPTVGCNASKRKKKIVFTTEKDITQIKRTYLQISYWVPDSFPAVKRPGRGV